MTIQTTSAALLKTRPWAVVRLALGLAQMGGVVTAFCLLWTEGVTRGALTAVVLTSGATTLSVMLFGRDRPRGPV